jgi:hypothetical protein
MLRQKKTKVFFIAVALVGLSTLVAFQAHALVDPGGGEGYCKNDPHRNTGVCFKSTAGVFSCLEAQAGATNKDCYGVQN